ncbi:MAG: GTP 3',8-cyclase MoaA [Opitutales bacterium]
MSFPRDALNRPLKDLRVSVTDRCNLRCGYCMPADVFGHDYPFLNEVDILDFKEIARLCRLFVQCGVKKIRITGGEPLLRSHLPNLIDSLANIDGVEDLALTTNGLRLKEMALPLKNAGLGRVTVSLDALSGKIAKQLNGRADSAERTLSGIMAAQDAGLSVKVNAVIQKGLNEGEILPLAKRFKGTGVTLRFIEFMDVGNHNGWREDLVFKSDEVLDVLKQEFPIEPIPPNYIGEVATRYSYSDGQGELGVVSSVSQPFCGDCSRARLTADGKLVTCLFAKDGHDLAHAMRCGADDETLLGMILNIWRGRSDRYSEQRVDNLKKSNHRSKVEMSYLGG